MRKSRFGEEQIISILQEHEAGAEVGELLRRHNISREAFYCWKRKFGGIGVSDVQRLKQLEAENERLPLLGRAPLAGSLPVQARSRSGATGAAAYDGSGAAPLAALA